MPSDPVLKWLLEGDPAIRWQALRDLKGAAERTVRREQRRVAEEGWGARLLSLQDADGRWAGGIYTPKWTSTTYTMVLLRSLGLAPGHPQAMRACLVLLDAGFWDDGGINFWRHSNQHSTASSIPLTQVSLRLCEWTDWRSTWPRSRWPTAAGIAAPCRAMAAPRTDPFTPPFRRWKGCSNTRGSASLARFATLRRAAASFCWLTGCSGRIGPVTS